MTKFEELLKETEDYRRDAILLCETWRPSKSEPWESEPGPIYTSGGGFNPKHGVGMWSHRRWTRKILKTEYVSERMITAVLKIQSKRNVLASENFTHTEYTNTHIE